MSVNDLIFSRLSATPGSINDKLIVFYQANGATSEALADAESEFLLAQDGVVQANILDMWWQFLTGLGYVGNVRDLKNQYWAGLLPPANLAAHWDGSVASSITEETGVSVWSDLSGNGRKLIQATPADQPIYNPVTMGITFDGVSQFLKTAFPLAQPETVYLVMQQVTWTEGDYIVDGDTVDSMNMFQGGSSPNIHLYAGALLPPNSNLAVGADGVVAALFNGASSSSKVNNTTAVIGDAGTINAGGLTLGASGAITAFANIIVYEVAIYNVAHSASEQNTIIDQLINKWKISNLVAHYDASVASSITEETGVSNWADLSGNGRDLVQATGADQPIYSAANNSITFDGLSQFMKTAAFPLVQPETMYIVMQQIAWTTGEYIFDGAANDSFVLYQSATTPNIRQFAGLSSTENANLAVGADGVVCAVFDAASSSLRVNKTAAATGDAGAVDAGGLTLGANGNTTIFSDIIVYEVAIYNVAHTESEQTTIINQMMSKWGIV